MSAFAALLLAPVAAAAAIAAPVAEPAAVTIALHPAIERASTRFEGWGTALAWFAEVTGGWPDADRRRLADLFYGADGLGWTIARFNIGGGDAAGTVPYMRPGGAIPGYWRLTGEPAGWRADDPAAWDADADPRQRWWLGAVKARVTAALFEAFSNSPPWFMTVSRRVSGAQRARDDNLLPGQENAFAAYLAGVVDLLQRREGIAFRTLSPVNEPGTDYWYAGNRQEGAHWSPTRQAAMIDATHAALRARGLATQIAAPDETSAPLFLADWAAYPPATRARIGQVNVHSYGIRWQSGVRDAARAAHIRLWMSEDDGGEGGTREDAGDMGPALAFAEHVVGDLKRLEPAAWVLWQAVEDFSTRGGAAGSNWGLVKADLRAPDAAPHPISVTRKYWAMAQFSRYVRPGYRLVPVDDPDTVAALSPDGATLALVHVNGGITARRLVLPAGWRATSVVTDATHEATRQDGTLAPPRAIVTLLATRTRALSTGRTTPSSPDQGADQ